MRIAMILPSLEQSGPGIVARDLCREFISLGHECCIFYFTDKFGLEIPCPAKKIYTSEDVNPQEWDIIHTHGFRADKYAYKIKKKIRASSCKLISTLHQPISIIELNKSFNIAKSIIGSLLWHKYLKCHDKIACLNSHTLIHLSKKIRHKSSVIFNGRSFLINDINNEKDYCLIKNLKSKYRIIGTNSGINKRKGLEQIIKALPLLPDYAFIAVGDGEERNKLIELAGKLKVSERCLFLGFRPNSTDYLQFYDIFIMCTRSEGFPLAFVEAASLGLPTVLSDIPILKSIVDSDYVSFYHIDDIPSLVNSVLSATKSSKGILLKSFYDKELTSSAMAERYLRFYQKN